MIKILYSDIALKDLEKLSFPIQTDILHSIEMKLGTNPLVFSKSLKYGLKDFRCLRINSYRIVFFMKKETVMILLIDHRKEIYDRVKRKLGVK